MTVQEKFAARPRSLASGRLPNLVIGGAPKSGTSSVFTWLADHPKVQGSTEKETYFFCDPGTHMYRPDRNFAAGLEGYRSYFPDRDGSSPEVVFEATPSYLYSKVALENLPDLETEPKLVFILREPAAQIYSLYSYFRNNWDWIPSDMGFGEFVQVARDGKNRFKGNELAQNALDFAKYELYLTRWEQRLGRERMCVLTFDELKADPIGLMCRIAAFAGLSEYGFYESYSFPLDNETYAVRNHGLQKLNVFLRSKLPAGPIYKALRRFYRSINTTRPPKASAGEQEVLSALRQEFAPYNASLATRYELDLSAWPT